jgi:hypothetical protein
LGGGGFHLLLATAVAQHGAGEFFLGGVLTTLAQGAHPFEAESERGSVHGPVLDHPRPALSRAGHLSDQGVWEETTAMLMFLPKPVLVGLVATAAALPPFTLAPKHSPDTRDAALLHNAATGCHPTYDRFVLQADFNPPGYDARYVRRLVYDPSGRPVSLAGTARIRVVFKLAGGHNNRGTNLLPGTLTPRCPNLLQVKKAGDFEGTVSFGLGLRRVGGFRVFRLQNPTRVVIDVSH